MYLERTHVHLYRDPTHLVCKVPLMHDQCLAGFMSSIEQLPIGSQREVGVRHLLKKHMSNKVAV